MITLDSFITLKKLTIENIVIESRIVKGDYVIEKISGEKIKTQLIYSYDNNYFDRMDPGDVNLASIMIAQVALNYGLFFERIEFDCPAPRTSAI